MYVIKRNGDKERFSKAKVERCLNAAFEATTGKSCPKKLITSIILEILDIKVKDDATSKNGYSMQSRTSIDVEEIQDIIENQLMMHGHNDVAREYIIYRQKHANLRDWVNHKCEFIEKYKASDNTANATIDDNSNVASKNIGIMNNEIHKEDNVQLNRHMVVSRLRQLYPDFDAKQYLRDLEHHIIYKHDESSFAGAIAPYCCSITMYPFLTNGIRDIGGLSAQPKNLDSFCGMYINLIFATSAQFAGAVATSEFLLYFDYFARKEYGNDYYKHTERTARVRYHEDEWYETHDISHADNIQEAFDVVSIREQLHQYFQQVVYSINQPAAARGLQSAFVNFSYFDKNFFDGMFGNFIFPDMTTPIWESFNWLQREFMMWFNEERTKTMLTFPVESFALVYQDGKFLDEDSAKFVAEEYARGHSFFTYISDTVDSLSSCCRLKNALTTKEFNFTNGNMGVQTGSKSVITLNLNRIVQDFCDTIDWSNDSDYDIVLDDTFYSRLNEYINVILERVYKYHTAYNSLLQDMLHSDMLPVYKAGFINLNNQYLTIGINGLNEAAEYLRLECRDNEDYRRFCTTIFENIKVQNTAHKTRTEMFNTECVPAESLAIKNYNWDKSDGYWVPETRNLYASYIFIPSDSECDIDDKIRMHGRTYIGDFLDGGSAAHLNLSEHLSATQYEHILRYAAEVGCQYLTFNVPNTECNDCGKIYKQKYDKCPNCGSTKLSYYDRIIGYLTKIDNWNIGRQIEQKTRIYEQIVELHSEEE